MVDLKYINHLGQTVDFSSLPFYIQEPEKLFGYEWSYVNSSQITSLTSFTKGITTKDGLISIFADSQEEYSDILDNFLSVVEADIAAEIPGKLVFGEYYTRCYIIASNIDDWQEDFFAADKQIKIALEDGRWIREIPISIRWEGQPENPEGLDYPYDYEYDYKEGSGYNSDITTDSFGDMEFILTIYGYANVPEISIGENTYRLNYTIQAGERVIINSSERTVLLVKTNGVVMNLFRYRDERHYIFEKINPGKQMVYWNSPFDFDLLLFEERSEPGWM